MRNVGFAQTLSVLHNVGCALQRNVGYALVLRNVGYALFFDSATTMAQRWLRFHPLAQRGLRFEKEYCYGGSSSDLAASIRDSEILQILSLSTLSADVFRPILNLFRCL